MDSLDLNSGNPGVPKTLQLPCPYAASIASSASSSSSSIFSLDYLSSQDSISSVSTTAADVIWENEVSGVSSYGGLPNASNSHCLGGGRGYGSKAAESAVAPEQRQNPRRTSAGVGCAVKPPSLVRQSDRRIIFVDSLVDSAAQIVEAIWPLSAVAARPESVLGCKGVLPLRSFIQETLRRSRTSYSTLQVALYYLILIKPRIPARDFTMEQTGIPQSLRAMQCGRRMFLAALILASKYLQDRNYSARAWSKISGLSTGEINQNELTFLDAVRWRLHISEPVFQRWTDVVLKYTPSNDRTFNGEGLCWRSIIQRLTPELDTIDFEPLRIGDGVILIQDLLSPSGTPSPSRSPVSEEPALRHFAVGKSMITEVRQEIQLPILPKRAVVSTSQLSPQSLPNSTPAAGAAQFNARGPSMSCAMQKVHAMRAQRTTLDQRPPLHMYNSKPACYESYPPYIRRSSLARSSTSSPESMISDVPSLTSSRSSRSSRSSSISSVASGTCAPTLPRLASGATRRCAILKDRKKNLTIATPIEEGSYSDICASPEPISASSTNMPDLSNFSLDTPVNVAHEAAQSLCKLSVSISRDNPPLSTLSSPDRKCRKRGRTGSNDMTLQHNVRRLMSLSSSDEDDPSFVLPDSQVADSFLLAQPKAIQSPSKSSFGSLKLPLPLALPMEAGSMKRACCGREAARFLWAMRTTGDNILDMVD
ncbi:PHO85 cyclin-5 [Emydomyces testavorans]|uniref:PHO85 cyclin-5 n=1 Tax=Emydomyces testavorans TaxID=2070801 RepID=A0AAF0IJD7_9EURO|nr:PHO85 cyclin-5 [Emydomyces testavorans]